MATTRSLRASSRCLLSLVCLACGDSQDGAGPLLPSPDAIAQAAVLVGSCVSWPDVTGAAGILWDQRSTAGFLTADNLRCILDTRSGCAGVHACLGLEYRRAPGCTPKRTCAGTVFYRCASDQEVEMDCGKWGLACDPLGACREAPVSHCTQGLAEPDACSDDGKPRFCDDGATAAGPICAELGLECLPKRDLNWDDAWEGWCVGTGPECAPVAGPGYTVHYEGLACEGNTLLTCVNGREHERDCAALAPGMACQELEGTAFCGISDECLPSPADPFSGEILDERCEGDSLLFCSAGRLEHVDCTALGFSGCDLEKRGCFPNLSTQLAEPSE